MVAKNDRQLRIEVGYGLEGAIPDAIAKRVIAEIITPYFKPGDFYAGIEAGVQQLMKLIDGEPLPPPSAHDDNTKDTGNLVMVVFTAVVFGAGFLGTLFGRLIGSAIAGVFVTVFLWVSLGTLLVAVLVGLGVFVFSILWASMGGSGIYTGSGRGGGLGGGFTAVAASVVAAADSAAAARRGGGDDYPARAVSSAGAVLAGTPGVSDG